MIDLTKVTKEDSELLETIAKNKLHESEAIRHILRLVLECARLRDMRQELKEANSSGD
jgi:hypothetical protein